MTDKQNWTDNPKSFKEYISGKESCIQQKQLNKQQTEKISCHYLWYSYLKKKQSKTNVILRQQIESHLTMFKLSFL